ncbi:hypothetical protein [Pseudonocardia acidicola]|uniref:Uncharacterized protein n=1 Tax=Pseudonocardia acidicola TaxID=2724939 RepID=A0ABX1SBH4_9PSEU|nr:hypothetical protein [Pseudonocardia acidicola]NMH98905.1 hypothetical protein [Pseudonocardia acidicola]
MTADEQEINREYARKRIWDDSAEGITVHDPDPVTHSQEAMRVLMEHGVDAYQAYLAGEAHRAG